jgi:hypothetical protein
VRVAAEQSPARRTAEGEHEQQAVIAQVGVDGSRARTVGFEVGQHERLRIRRACERDAGELADGAVGAVAPNDVVGLDLLGVPVAVAQRAGDVIRVLGEPEQLDATLDPRSAGDEVVAEDGLGLCLGEEQQERKARRRDRCRTAAHVVRNRPCISAHGGVAALTMVSAMPSPVRTSRVLGCTASAGTRGPGRAGDR